MSMNAQCNERYPLRDDTIRCVLARDSVPPAPPSAACVSRFAMLALVTTTTARSREDPECKPAGQPLLGSPLLSVINQVETLLNLPIGALTLTENGATNILKSIVEPVLEELSKRLNRNEWRPVYLSGSQCVSPGSLFQKPMVEWLWSRWSFKPAHGGKVLADVHKMTDLPTAILCVVAIASRLPTPADREELKTRLAPDQMIEMLVASLEWANDLLFNRNRFRHPSQNYFNSDTFYDPVFGRPREACGLDPRNGDTPNESSLKQINVQFAKEARVVLEQTKAALLRVLDAAKAVQPLLKSGEIQIPPAQVVFLLAKALAVVAWAPPSDQALQRALTPRAHEYKTAVESFSVEQYMELKGNEYEKMEEEFRGELVKLHRQWMNTHDFRSNECKELLIRWRDDPHNSDLTNELVKEWGFELPSSKWGLSLPAPPPQADDYFSGMREGFVRMKLGFLSILAVNPERAIFGVERDLDSVRSLISLNQDKDWPKDRFKADQRAIGGKASIETALEILRAVDTRTTEEELKEARLWMKSSDSQGGDARLRELANHLWDGAVVVGTHEGWKTHHKRSRQKIQEANDNTPGGDDFFKKMFGWSVNGGALPEGWASNVWIKPTKPTKHQEGSRKRKPNGEIAVEPGRGLAKGPFPDKSWGALKSNKMMYDMADFVQADTRSTPTPRESLIKEFVAFTAEPDDIIHRVKEGTTRPVWEIKATDQTFLVVQVFRFAKHHLKP